MFFSASQMGFYDPALGPIPDDAVEIEDVYHRELLVAQSSGCRIAVDKDGFPVALKLEIDRRAEATALVKQDAERRILAIAAPWRQANDAACIAQAALEMSAGAPAITVDFAPALDRRRAIDAIRRTSDSLCAWIAAMPEKEIATVDWSADQHWQED